MLAPHERQASCFSPPVRNLRDDDLLSPRPIYVVWELTMKCDQPCQHCGSRAGPRARGRALDRGGPRGRGGPRPARDAGGDASSAARRTSAPTSTRSCAPSPGAASASRCRRAGARSPSSGRRALRDAGLDGLGVSVDGPARVHDRLRGNVGSHEAARAGAEDRARGGAGALGEHAGEPPQPPITSARRRAQLRALGVQAWQVQLTGPHGPRRRSPGVDPRAVEHRRGHRHAGGDPARGRPRRHAGGVPFNVACNNNLGYFGPHEQILRSRPGEHGDALARLRRGHLRDGHRVRRHREGLPDAAHRGVRGRQRARPRLEEIWASSPAIRFARDRTHRRALGLLQDLLLRRRLPGRLLVDGAHARWGGGGTTPSATTA